jgi:hypothetical protein
MQLAIDVSTGKVLAKYNDGQHIEMSQYGDDVELIQWSKPFSMVLDDLGELPNDPRNPSERAVAATERHLVKRLQSRPSVRKCLEMIYRDMRDGTSTYVDALEAIDAQFPERPK